jgi:hypothetical protein
MKKFQRILIKFIIFILVLLCFYIVRGDIMILINKINPNFNNEKVENFVAKVNQKREAIMPGKVDLPGALRIVNDFVNVRKDNIILSKEKIIELTNTQRKENGNLIALKENKYLNISAENKLKDMFAKQYFEHISPSGIGVGDLGEESGYKYILIGENLAMGNFEDDSDLVNAWMNSTGHRANILNINYREIGVAVLHGKFEGKDVWIAVQHFGTSRNFCPYVDQNIYESVTYKQEQVKQMEENLLERQERLNNGIFDEGTSHRVQIDNYNSLIEDYNNLIQKIKLEVDIYNEQVKSFNNCILKYE